MRPNAQGQADVQPHPPEKHPESHAEGETPRDNWVATGLLATCSLPGTHDTWTLRPRRALTGYMAAAAADVNVGCHGYTVLQS